MTQTPYHRHASSAIPKHTRLEPRPTQDQQILDLLVENHPNWVPLPRILALGISQYSARIWTLRHQRGFNIENRLVDLPDGRKGGEFRLCSLLPGPQVAESPALAPTGPTPRFRGVTAQSATNLSSSGEVGVLFSHDPAWQEGEALHRQIRERQCD